MFNRISNLIKSMIDPDYDPAQAEIESEVGKVECDWCTRLGITAVRLQDTDNKVLKVRACNMHEGHAHTLVNDWIDQRLNRADVRRRLGLDDDLRS